MTIDIAGSLAAALAATCAVLAPFAERVRPPRARHPDARALADAGFCVPLWRWEALRVACVVAALAVAAVSPIPQPIAMTAGALAPSVVARSRAQAARREARAAVTRLLRATEAALGSGASLPEALRRATEACPDRLARGPFEAALRAFDLGAPLDEALRASENSASDARVRVSLRTIAIGIASRLPADRSSVMVAAVAERLAFHEGLDAEVRARTSGQRLQALLLALIVPALAGYLALTVPSLAATLGSPLGQLGLIPGAVALEAIGVLASRRAVEGAVP